MNGKYRGFLLIVILSVLSYSLFAQDDLRIDCEVVPSQIYLGEEGTLKIRLTPRPGIRLSAHPELLFLLEESEQFSFPKLIFRGSEFNLSQIQQPEGIFIELPSNIEIPFKVNENAYIGKHYIKGEITFTALSPDNWYTKTFQRFTASFSSRKPPAYKIIKKK